MDIQDDSYEWPSDMLSNAGKRMFNNELFSDAKVTVDDKTWPVHKSILCPRSAYFHKAFFGPFIESRTNHLTIEGQTAEAVGLSFTISTREKVCPAPYEPRVYFLDH